MREGKVSFLWLHALLYVLRPLHRSLYDLLSLLETFKLTFFVTPTATQALGFIRNMIATIQLDVRLLCEPL